MCARACVCVHVRVCLCVSSPCKQDLKTLWLRDLTAQRHTATSKKIFWRDSKLKERMFPADSASLDLALGSQEPPRLSVSFCVVLRREGIRLERGALRCLLEPFSVTLCCVFETLKETFEQVSNVRCLFKKRRKKLFLSVHKKIVGDWEPQSGLFNAGHAIILQIITH